MQRRNPATCWKALSSMLIICLEKDHVTAKLLILHTTNCVEFARGRFNVGGALILSVKLWLKLLISIFCLKYNSNKHTKHTKVRNSRGQCTTQCSHASTVHMTKLESTQMTASHSYTCAGCMLCTYINQACTQIKR